MNQEYLRFLQCVEDTALREELEQIRGDEEEIASRFCTPLSFGTAGLRGVLGVGTARMNVYTVGRATQGLYDVIAPRARGERPTFAIAYDTRNMSDVFARRTAEVLTSRGAQVYLFSEPVPVPLLSYTIRALSCDAGVCITASHNPACYNGYKVFGADGCQLLDEDAQAVSRAAEGYDYFVPVQGRKQDVLSVPESVVDSYLAAISAPLIGRESTLRVVYTPLNGTGLRFVPRVLTALGYRALSLVPEQSVHDGNFPTCPKPNPEIAEAFSLCIEMARRQGGADLLLATDPDCDRVGIAVPEGEGFRLLTGNETGLLLLDYLLSRRRAAGEELSRLVACTTIVSAEMADAIAQDYGIELRRVLTGFKYIGRTVCELAQAGQSDRFLFGFEESYGYLASDTVRDKDACEAAALICNMVRDLREAGMSVQEKLAELQARYGVYRSSLYNFEFKGSGATEQSAALMRRLRETPPCLLGGERVCAVTDYAQGVGGLVPADVLCFCTETTKLIVRPSGTEPKVKFYLFSRADTATLAEERLALLQQTVRELIAE